MPVRSKLHRNQGDIEGMFYTMKKRTQYRVKLALCCIEGAFVIMGGKMGGFTAVANLMRHTLVTSRDATVSSSVASEPTEPS
jgi:hypothetical protein